MKSKLLLSVGCIVVVSCAEPPSLPQASMPEADAIVGWLSINASGAVNPSDAGTYEHVVTCPLGGRITHSWTSTIQTDGDVDRVIWSGSIQKQACALRVESAEVTLDGNTQLEGETRIRRPQPGQRSTLLYSRAHESGQLTSTSGNRRQTCVLDLVRTFEPELNALRIRGVYCNSVIDLQLPPRP